MRSLRLGVAAGLLLLALASAVVLGRRALAWNDQLVLDGSPLSCEAPILDDPKTRALSRRVIVAIIDGLGADESKLPFLDELRARGVAAVAQVPYPTLSRPNYVTILTGVPPRDSGVRTNRVRAPVGVDSLMDRVQAAGKRTATASTFISLFVRNSKTVGGIEWIEEGTLVKPPPPITWPFDEAHRPPTLADYGPIIARLAKTDAALITTLVLDVDRAGHKSGVGDAYRAAARAADDMLRVAFADLDFTRDTVIVTADHGHVAPGGHGGLEDEVRHVPLILAGAGVVPGATPRDPWLLDIAPTAAALLGVPAPGHASGRALVEVLALDEAERARRAAADERRARAVAPIVEAARDAAPDPARFAIFLVGLVIAAGAAWFLARRRALAFTGLAPSGAVAFLAMLFAMFLITRFTMSPSYVPASSRVMKLGILGTITACAMHVVACWWFVLRREADRVVAANGLAVVGLTASLATVALVRAWFSPPFYDVPSPFWMVAIPAIDLAAATGALGTAVMLASALIRRGRLTTPAP